MKETFQATYKGYRFDVVLQTTDGDTHSMLTDQDRQKVRDIVDHHLDKAIEGIAKDLPEPERKG